jgi:putative ABC transport system permease protein
MIKSYLTIALRNILRSKGYSFINIFGLALGIASCLLMFHYVSFELSYDDFHPHIERTYRVDQQRPERDAVPTGSTAPPLAATMKNNYPEVEETLRINTPGDFIIRYSESKDRMIAYQEGNIFAADSTFFSFFGYRLKEGNPRTALQGLNKVVISEETARKLFGDAPALGKILELGEDRKAVEVTGVTERQPDNAHFHFDYLLSMETNPNVLKRDFSWVWTQVVTYVRLKPGSDVKQTETKLLELGERFIRPQFESLGWDYDNGGARKQNWNFYLRPMRDVHLKTGSNRIGPVGNINYVRTFAVIGIFVLVIASINFINLSTARGAKRAKEVGVKKTLGATRRSLVSQFQTESIFLTTIASVLAIGLAEVLRFMIGKFVGISIASTLWQNVSAFVALPLIPIVIGFLAGLYPSFFLTAFRPVQVLKGKIASGMGNASLRNVLVVIQFTISIALIAGTLIVFQQLKFMSTKSLGFDKENILLVKYAEKLGTNLETVQDEIKTYPGVEHVGVAMEVPGGGTWTDGLRREGSDVNVPIALVKINESYFKALGFELVAGRLFDEARPSDRNAVVPNETAIRQFGWTPEQALGQYIVYPGNDNSRHEVIGVMKDSHYQSLRQAITPVMFCKTGSDIWGDWFVIAVKFKTADLPDLIKRIETKWNETLDDTPFTYSFLDQDLARQYQDEQKLGALFAIFSSLSILIAIIGLIGLVSYSAEIRKKEIGIRKVFGASAARILVLFNRSYVWLVFVSFVLASPIAWYFIAQWLNEFAYRIEISPLTFLLAGLCELVLALLTVGYLSIRAALLNPAKVLREE